MVQARRVHRRPDVHIEFQHIQQHAQHGVNDRAAAGTAGHQHHLAVFRDDRRRLRAEHPLAGGDLIGQRADRAGPVGNARPPVEVDHFIVQQKPRPLHDNARAVAAFQRVGVGDRHAVFVDHGKVRGAVPFATQRDVLGQVFAARRALRIDPLGQLAGIVLAGQVRRNRHEIGIAEMPGTVAVHSPHRLDHQMERRR